MSDEYALVPVEKADGNFPVLMMCRILEVSRSGFYDWEGREVSAQARRREELTSMVAYKFDHSERAYGHWPHQAGPLPPTPTHRC